MVRVASKMVPDAMGGEALRLRQIHRSCGGRRGAFMCFVEFCRGDGTDPVDLAGHR